MQRIIWWLRRDLRLTDNLVLHQAWNDGAAVIPVFILDPVLLNSRKLAPARKRFLFESLAELDTNLKKRGSYLVLRRGPAERVLAQLVQETRADAVYFHTDYTPYAHKRDAAVRAALDRAGIRHTSFNDCYLADPNKVTKQDSSPYTVYTAYRKRFERVIALPPRLTVRKNLNTPPGIATFDLAALKETRVGLQTRAHADTIRGGEGAAMRQARDFMARKNGLMDYMESRNDMGADATSHLSPHLHFGTISVRELVRMTREAIPPRPRRQTGRPARHASENAGVWIQELVWREFFNQVLYHFPHAARGAFRSRYANLEWVQDPEWFAAWCGGQTGYPLVDAGMRELQATGWMHNRARMVTASFLTRDLLLNWQWGESFFLQHLVDGDMASNNGGWQWAAGRGPTRSPIFASLIPLFRGAVLTPREPMCVAGSPNWREYRTNTYMRRARCPRRRRGALA